MEHMKSKTIHSLIITLILTVGHPTSVTSVSDAEFEALEKQIEQLEADEKNKADAIEKKKAEAEKKRLAELERQRQAEEERQRLVQEKKEEETLSANLGQTEVGNIRIRAKKDASSLKKLIRLADLGNPYAQFDLGSMYENGLGGLPKDERKAVELYKKSAAQAFSYAQYYLGLLYYNGQGGLPKDYRKAVELLEKSAAQGDQHGQMTLKLIKGDTW